MPDQNPLLTGAPTWADAYSYNANALSGWMTHQQQISADRGLWQGGQPWEGGGPTAAGIVNAGQQYGNALLMGTTAPGAPHFALDPYDLKPASNLTAAQQGAVDHYASGSSYLNGDSPEAEELRRHLDTAIGVSRLSDNARLYRGFSIPRQDIENIKPGDVVPLSSGYVSTTTSKDRARQFADDNAGGDTSILAELRVPRGHPALHVPTDKRAAAELGGDQQEILLPRNMQFRIHSVNEKSDGNFEVLAVPAD